MFGLSLPAQVEVISNKKDAFVLKFDRETPETYATFIVVNNFDNEVVSTRTSTSTNDRAMFDWENYESLTVYVTVTGEGVSKMYPKSVIKPDTFVDCGCSPINSPAEKPVQ